MATESTHDCNRTSHVLFARAAIMALFRLHQASVGAYVCAFNSQSIKRLRHGFLLRASCLACFCTCPKNLMGHVSFGDVAGFVFVVYYTCCHRVHNEASTGPTSAGSVQSESSACADLDCLANETIIHTKSGCFGEKWQGLMASTLWESNNVHR